ncbi:MAG: FAD-binding oxidoreductase [Methylococcaceae bacterium]|nr:FAD-binding oxidoreductase [Methylococcaceae bacterium]
MKINFLIVGQGLAGSLLAWELMRRGCRVVIIDNGQENASRVAAGLINPMTGMRLVKSADVDILLPAAIDYYAQLADFFKQCFYHEKPLLRIFRNQDELMYGRQRLIQTDYQPYLTKLHAPEELIHPFMAPLGFLEQQKTGYLLTNPLLSCLKQYFIAHSSYRQATFDYQAMQLTPTLQWKDMAPERIIFCEGYQVEQNPWFSWLPLQPAKGEILTLRHKILLPDKIINFGQWLIPLAQQQSRMGATFDHTNLSTDPTEQARNDLLRSLQTLAPTLQSTVMNHQAGIRPCTQDRQPLIGNHPKLPKLAVFNGFGAKGSLQIPWYAQHFADVLEKKIPLLKPCDSQRYEAHFTDSKSPYTD